MTDPVVCGIPDAIFPVPGDPNLNISVLSVSVRHGGLLVSWTWPSLLGHAVANVEVWRSTASSLVGATKIVVVQGNQYFDPSTVSAPTTYYYWIRMTSVNGTVGNYIGPASGVINTTVSYMIAELQGQIRESELFASLITTISGIATAQSAIAQEIIDRGTADSLAAGGLATLTNSLSAVDTLLTNEITNRVAGDTALVSQVNTIAVVSNNAAAGLISEQTVRASADGAMALDITQLETTVNNAATGVSATSGIVSGLSATVDHGTTGVVANNTAILALNSTVNDATSGVVATALATDNLSTTVNHAGTGVSATANKVLALEGSLQDSDGNVIATATLVNQMKVEVQGDSSTSPPTTGLKAEYTLQTEVNGYLSGFGTYNDGQTSEFIILANKFALAVPPPAGTSNPTTNNANDYAIPFVAITSGGQTNIVMDASVYIKDLSVTTAEIADLTVTTGKIADLAVDTLKIAGNSVVVSDAATPTYGSNTRDLTLAMQGDSTLGSGQKFIFHINGIVGNTGSNPSTYDMKVTTTLANGYGVIDVHWYYAYGPDSVTVTRTLNANSQICRCRVQLLMHGTNTPVPNGHITITAHGGKR